MLTSEDRLRVKVRCETCVGGEVVMELVAENEVLQAALEYELENAEVALRRGKSISVLRLFLRDMRQRARVALGVEEALR